MRFTAFLTAIRQRWFIGLLIYTLVPVLGNVYGEPLQLTPVPPGASQWDSSKPSNTSDRREDAIKLEVRKEGLPKAILFRQLQPQRYAKYEQKTKTLNATLKEALAYMDSLKGAPPSLQRLSAFSAEATLDWNNMEKVMTPEEKSFRSYQLMKEAVEELRSLTSYWITTERVRRVFRGTVREAEEDSMVMFAKRTKIRSALEELNQMDAIKRDLNAEIPY